MLNTHRKDVHDVLPVNKDVPEKPVAPLIEDLYIKKPENPVVPPPIDKKS